MPTQTDLGLDLKHAPLRVAMVAGETSGDLLAGLLMSGLKHRWPNMQSFGIGGPRMQAQGFQAWWPHERLAVRGYVEVLRHYRGILAIRRQLAERLLASPPDVFIGVDAPDFNLGLEKQLKAAGIKAVHFVSPSIWAWRGERVHKIKDSVDHMLCLFPFEPELYAKVGMAATYVGHPLADVIPMEPPRVAARQKLGLNASDLVVAVLPGSRASEIEYIAPTFLQAMVLLHQTRPELQFLLPAVPASRERVKALVQQYASGVPVQVLDGQSHEALAACDVTLIASGTATLEAALFKCPMVIAYRMNPLTWFLMKRKRYQPWVGLPNILARDFLVPERIQEEATPSQLAKDVLAWLDQPQRRSALMQRYIDIHHSLRRDTARSASDAIAKVLGQ
jgi:lipid-A-disaccharide synthase